MNRNTMNSDKTSRDILIGHGSAGNNVEGAANNDLQHEDETPVEDWSTAGIGNAFLFGKVMTANPDLLLRTCAPAGICSRITVSSFLQSALPLVIFTVVTPQPASVPIITGIMFCATVEVKPIGQTTPA